MDRLILSPIDAMTPFLQKALLALDKALDEGDLAAAKEVFDRIYGKPMQRQQSDTSPRITIVFTDHEPTAVIDITPQGSSNQAED